MIDRISAEVTIHFLFKCRCGKTEPGTARTARVFAHSAQSLALQVAALQPASADMPVGWARRADWSFCCPECAHA
jgi:hypothetical protein